MKNIILIILVIMFIWNYANAQKGTIKAILNNDTEVKAQKYQLLDDKLILYANGVMTPIPIMIKDIDKIEAQRKRNFRFLYTSIGILVGVFPGIYATVYPNKYDDVRGVYIKESLIGGVLGGFIGYQIANNAFVKFSVKGDRSKIEKQKEKLKQFQYSENCKSLFW